MQIFFLVFKLDLTGASYIVIHQLGEEITNYAVNKISPPNFKAVHRLY